MKGTKNERDFFRIVSWTTAMAFGVLAAFLYSMKDIIHDPRLEFSPGTVVVFVIAAVVGWGFWRVVLKHDAKKK